MADAQYEFRCEDCKRTFRGTEHSIRAMTARSATCSYCRGKLAFPTDFTTAVPAARAGEKLELVDRIIARSTGPVAATAWTDEIPAALLQAEVFSIVAAALLLNRFGYDPAEGLLVGFGASAGMLAGAVVYPTLRAADIGLFRGKGFFLRAVFGPLLLVIGFGALLSPFNRTLRTKLPALSSVPVMVGSLLVCLAIVGALQAIHHPVAPPAPAPRADANDDPLSE